MRGCSRRCCRDGSDDSPISLELGSTDIVPSSPPFTFVFPIVRLMRMGMVGEGGDSPQDDQADKSAGALLSHCSLKNSVWLGLNHETRH